MMIDFMKKMRISSVTKDFGLLRLPKEVRALVLPVFIVLIIVLGPISFVSFVYRNTLTFQPDLFLNQCFGFFISFLSFIVSFFISQVFWLRRVSLHKINENINLLIHYLDNLCIIIYESNAAISKDIFDSIESLNRDKEVIANFIRLKDHYKYVGEIVSKLIENTDLENDIKAKCIFLRSSIMQELEYFSNITQIRPLPEDLQERLSKLGTSLYAVMNDLRRTVR